jgi:TRAP-type C4-dicarboxylate transport system permease small subunit
MIEFLRKIDRGWARGESWVTFVVLILMVLVAGFQASVRNLTRFDIQWAANLLTNMEWADSFMRKGTLWLAFLGASLATHYHKHIAIDVVLRMAPPRSKYWMLTISGMLAGVITLGLAVCFADAVKLNLTERPLEYELLGTDGNAMHICDASPQQLAGIEDAQRPTVFCAVRSVLAAISVPAETEGAAFQIIVPVMFIAIALRLFGHALGYLSVALGGEAGIAAAEEDEKRRILAQRQAVEPTAAAVERGES